MAGKISQLIPNPSAAPTQQIEVRDGSSNYSTSLSELPAALSLVVGADIQAYSSSLEQLAAITFVPGDLIYHAGGALVRLPNGMPGQHLEVSGGGLPSWEDQRTTRYSVKQKSSNYTALDTDDVIECLANTFTIDLFTAVGNIGKQLIIKNSGAGIITVDASGGETIDGSLTADIPPLNSIAIVSNDTNWIIV